MPNDLTIYDRVADRWWSDDIRWVRTPLGVVGVIYESRPNVTADAGALCLKAGNAVILTWWFGKCCVIGGDSQGTFGGAAGGRPA